MVAKSKKLKAITIGCVALVVFLAAAAFSWKEIGIRLHLARIRNEPEYFIEILDSPDDTLAASAIERYLKTNEGLPDYLNRLTNALGQPEDRDLRLSRIGRRSVWLESTNLYGNRAQFDLSKFLAAPDWESTLFVITPLAEGGVRTTIVATGVIGSTLSTTAAELKCSERAKSLARWLPIVADGRLISLPSRPKFQARVVMAKDWPSKHRSDFTASDRELLGLGGNALVLVIRRGPTAIPGLLAELRAAKHTDLVLGCLAELGLSPEVLAALACEPPARALASLDWMSTQEDETKKAIASAIVRSQEAPEHHIAVLGAISKLNAATRTYIAKSLAHEEHNVRAEAAYLIGRLASVDSELTEMLLAQVEKEKTVFVLRALARSLVQLAASTPESVDAEQRLIRLLSIDDAVVRSRLVTALGSLPGPKSPDVISALCKSAGDLDHRVRIEAVRSLGKLATRIVEVVKVLENAQSSDTDPGVRSEAEAALAKLARS